MRLRDTVPGRRKHNRLRPHPFDEERRGRPRFAERNMDRAALDRQAAIRDLDRFLTEHDIDLAQASNADIRELLQRESEALQTAGAEVFQAAPRPDTKEFRHWFGGSKVVDADGKPLVVYHGTAADVTAFDPSRIGENYSTDRAGFFFASHPDEASGFAVGDTRNIIPVFLSIQNPLVIEAGKDDTAEVWYRNRTAYKGQAETGGHDGVIVRGEPYFDGSPNEMYVAFSPTQVKSVFNRGSFSPSDPRILYQAAPVAILTGKEFGEEADDLPTLRKAASAWFRDNLQGKTVASATGPVRFSGTGRKKATSSNPDPATLRLIPAVADIISKGEYTGSRDLSKPRKDSIVRFHRFEADVSLAGKNWRAAVLVGEDQHGNLFYDLFKSEPPSGWPSDYKPGSEGGHDQSIAQPGSGINLAVWQPDGGAPSIKRGSFRFGGGEPVITLFEAADRSTFMHESARDEAC